MKKRVKKRHHRWWIFFRIVLTLPFRLFFRYKAKNFRLEKNKPYLILSNHVAIIDPIYLGLSFSRNIYFVTYAGVCNGKYGPILDYLFAPIAKTKGKTDISTIRECISVIADNGVVCLFPSGDTTFTGTESPIERSVVRFIRMMNADLILYRLDGIYGVSPRWGHKRRRGPSSGSVQRTVTAGEYKAMSDDELYGLVIRYIGIDNLNYIGDGRYYGSRCAEYLERALFVCPDCRKIGTMYSDHRYFRCRECGYSVVYLSDLTFELRKGEHYYRTVKEWYDFSKAELENKYSNGDFDTDDKIFSDRIRFLRKDGKKQYCRNGFLRLFKDRLEITDEKDRKDTVLPISGIKLVFHGKRNLVAYAGGCVFTAVGFDRFCGLKYIGLVDLLNGDRK